MSKLQLPAKASAGFRLEWWDAADARFTVNIYGAGRRGWFDARYRGHGQSKAVVRQELGSGEWRMFLGLIKQAGFWDLPELRPQAAPPTTVPTAGRWVTLAGSDGDRYHEVQRGEVDDGSNSELAQIERFLLRVANLVPSASKLADAAEGQAARHAQGG